MNITGDLNWSGCVRGQRYHTHDIAIVSLFGERKKNTNEMAFVLFFRPASYLLLYICEAVSQIFAHIKYVSVYASTF